MSIKQFLIQWAINIKEMNLNRINRVKNFLFRQQKPKPPKKGGRTTDRDYREFSFYAQ